MKDHRRPLSLLSPLLTVLTLLGCGRGDPDGHRFVESVVDGVAVAETSGGPRYDGPLFRFEPLLTLEEDPAEPESLLFQPQSIDLGPDGRYYVADGGNGRIAVYDAEGRFVHSFGRRGEGPGEFRYMDVQGFRDDVLSIFDYALQRTTWYRADGTLLEVFGSPIGGYAMWLERTPTGVFLQGGVRSELEGTTGYTERRVVLATAGRDTLAVLRTRLVAESYRKTMAAPQGGVLTMARPLTFSGSPTVQYVAGRGVLLTDGDRPELTWYDLDGREELRIRVDLPRRAVTAAMRDEIVAREQAEAERYTNRMGDRALPPGGQEFPGEAGSWRRVLVDDAGYIWCQDALTSYLRGDEEPHRFHVFAPGGRYLGIAETPAARFRITRGQLMCLLEDPVSGETRGTVFRMVPLAEGLVYY